MSRPSRMRGALGSPCATIATGGCVAAAGSACKGEGERWGFESSGGHWRRYGPAKVLLPAAGKHVHITMPWHAHFSTCTLASNKP
eukprot:1158392-Pelagomonas_calceolata.AAC.6